MQVAQSVAERMVSLADSDPIVTVTLDPADDGRLSMADIRDEPMVVVHHEHESSIGKSVAVSTSASTFSAASSHALPLSTSTLFHSGSNVSGRGPLGLSSAAMALLGADGGLRVAEGAIREQIHNRQNARDTKDRAAKAAEGK